MTGARFLDLAGLGALALLTLALLIALVRLWRGPGLPDRILALDLLTTLAVGYVGIVALRTGYALYVDIAIALALVGFVATVALARFVLDAAGQVSAGRQGKNAQSSESHTKVEGKPQ